MTDQHVQMLFSTIDMSSGWISRPGRDGVSEKILCGSLEDSTGRCTRLVKFEAGARAPQQEHVHWEESYLISGDLEIIDEEGVPVVRFDAPAYVCRPPKSIHGPFASEHGCLLLHIEYFAEPYGDVTVKACEELS